MNIQAREVSAPSIHSRDVAVQGRPTHTHETVHVVVSGGADHQSVVFYNASVAAGDADAEPAIGFRLPLDADADAFADAFLAGYAEPITLERLLYGGYGQSACEAYRAEYDEELEFAGVNALRARGLIEVSPDAN